MADRFDYQQAFSRNLGWVTEAEQQRLRGSRVAIAGMGGVGGAHLLTLTRLGIGSFAIADMDNFETVNTNRQAGAFTSTYGRPKVDVMAEMALDINPELTIRRFDTGFNEGTSTIFSMDATCSWTVSISLFWTFAGRHSPAAGSSAFRLSRRHRWGWVLHISCSNLQACPSSSISNSRAFPPVSST